MVPINEKKPDPKIRIGLLLVGQLQAKLRFFILRDVKDRNTYHDEITVLLVAIILIFAKLCGIIRMSVMKKESYMEPQIYNAEYTIHVSGADIKFYQMVYSPKKLYTVNHVHSHFELHYITEGNAVYTMNFHDEITLEKGDWLLINRNVYHEEIIPHACGGYVLGFNIQGMDQASFFASLPDLHYYKGVRDTELGEWMAKILLEAREQRPEYESYCKNLFAILLLHVQRSFTKQEAAKTSREMKMKNTYMIIDLFFNRIFGNEGQNLTMDELSSQLHISSRHLNRLLQEYYGVTFHEKLMATKIKYAEYLLRTTDYSVGEISTMCGVTAACLIDNFKRIHGVTPAKYKKFNETDTI